MTDSEEEWALGLKMALRLANQVNEEAKRRHSVLAATLRSNALMAPTFLPSACRLRNTYKAILRILSCLSEWQAQSPLSFLTDEDSTLPCFKEVRARRGVYVHRLTSFYNQLKSYQSTFEVEDTEVMYGQSQGPFHQLYFVLTLSPRSFESVCRTVVVGGSTT